MTLNRRNAPNELNPGEPDYPTSEGSDFPMECECGKVLENATDLAVHVPDCNVQSDTDRSDDIEPTAAL